MSKRYTDTERWERPWFRKLPKSYRWFWLYILDKCDAAGIWYVDMELASFVIGEELDYEMALDFFSKQIEAIDTSRWFVVDFVQFQYTCLSEDCPPHKKIIEKLKALNLLNRVPNTLTATLPSRVQEEEEEEEEESLKSLKTFATKKPKETTDIQRIVLSYKMASGFELEDKAWDKLNFARCSKAAKSLFDYFENWEVAADCVEQVYAKMSSKGLTCTLETVVKHASDWKQEAEKRGILFVPRNGSGSVN